MQKCINCKKEKGLHKSNTYNCPIGLKTRIGYIHFSEEKVFEIDSKLFPIKIYFDLNNYFGNIYSYDGLKKAILDVQESASCSLIEAINYFLDSYYHESNFQIDSIEQSNIIFTYKYSDITFKQWTKNNLDIKELAKIGIIL